MMMGLDMAAAAGFLVLASGAAGGGVECRLQQAPQINIVPVTKDIRYVYDLSAAELSRVQTDTVNPYGANADTTTGGLRHDRPEIKVEAAIGNAIYSNGQACLWYDRVNITITLQPQIYLAKEFNYGQCREAVLEHERRHVVVDRQVINRYAQRIGKTVEAVVNRTGAQGPLPKAQLVPAQERLMKQIQDVLTALEPEMQRDMQHHQGQVDTLEEYRRISKICNRRR